MNRAITPGRPFGLATLQVSFDFGGKSVADISCGARPRLRMHTPVETP
jgi:hypothetical protein